MYKEYKHMFNTISVDDPDPDSVVSQMKFFGLYNVLVNHKGRDYHCSVSRRGIHEVAELWTQNGFGLNRKVGGFIVNRDYDYDGSTSIDHIIEESDRLIQYGHEFIIPFLDDSQRFTHYEIVLYPEEYLKVWGQSNAMLDDGSEIPADYVQVRFSISYAESEVDSPADLLDMARMQKNGKLLDHHKRLIEVFKLGFPQYRLGRQMERDKLRELSMLGDNLSYLIEEHLSYDVDTESIPGIDPGETLLFVKSKFFRRHSSTAKKFKYPGFKSFTGHTVLSLPLVKNSDL